MDIYIAHAENHDDDYGRWHPRGWGLIIVNDDQSQICKTGYDRRSHERESLTTAIDEATTLIVRSGMRPKHLTLRAFTETNHVAIMARAIVNCGWNHTNDLGLINALSALAETTERFNLALPTTSLACTSEWQQAKGLAEAALLRREPV